jgi:predicted phage terminase large subunit-like protein
MVVTKLIKPQTGPQEDFLSSSADIAFYGGAAGAGKTFALLMEPLRHINIPNFGAVTFRRTMPQITSEGGLWDTSYQLYFAYNGRPINMPLRWTFPKKVKFTFHHLQYENTVHNWDGSQIPLLMFDEAQHFTEKQIFYMLTRNRSTCGIYPYCRGTCNPDPDSFLLKLLLQAGFVNEKTGYPIYENSGKLMWFVRIDGKLYWDRAPDKLCKRFKKSIPKSFTFIPGRLTDNKILMRLDPGYEANLKAQPEYERLRLEMGNWFARPNAGDLFKRHYWKPIDYDNVPSLIRAVRYWDRAATVPNDKNPDPNWTVGILIGECVYGKYYILDVIRDRIEPYDVQQLILKTAEFDGEDVEVWIEQDPGQAGKYERTSYEQAFEKVGKSVSFYEKGSGSKLSMWKPFAIEVKRGNVYVIKASWNNDFMNEMEGVTDGTQDGHDDQADASSGGFAILTGESSGSALGESVL